MATRTCRVGQVEGPFREAVYYADGTKKTGASRPKEPRPQFWTVRYMDGSVLRDRHFYSEAGARQFWESLPPWND